MAKSVVSIVKGTDPEKMVAESLDLLGGVSSLIKPGSRVVIKPNAGHPLPAETSVCTNPAVVAAVIKEVRKAGPREIIVAESAARGCDTVECFEVSGIGKAAEDAGADKIIDIKRDKDLIKIPIRDARSAVTSVLLPRFLLEAEHIISVPIFKTHVSMVFTGALKNIKGVVQDKVHYEMHQTDLAAAMMDVWSVVKADLSIADMIRPAEGFGPHHTIPAVFDCIVAGKDPVAVDATLCRMVGLAVDKVTYFEPARERNLGVFDEDQIEIRGRKIEEVYKELWIPYLGGFEQWPEYDIYADNACSSCQGLLAFTMEKMKAIGEYDKNAGITIVSGRIKQLPENVPPENLILFGDCVKKFRNQGVFIEGCPPGESRPLLTIIDRLKSESEKTKTGARTKEQMTQDTKKFVEYINELKKSQGK